MSDALLYLTLPHYGSHVRRPIPKTDNASHESRPLVIATWARLGWVRYLSGDPKRNVNRQRSSRSASHLSHHTFLCSFVPLFHYVPLRSFPFFLSPGRSGFLTVFQPRVQTARMGREIYARALLLKYYYCYYYYYYYYYY